MTSGRQKLTKLKMGFYGTIAAFYDIQSSTQYLYVVTKVAGVIQCAIKIETDKLDYLFQIREFGLEDRTSMSHWRSSLCIFCCILYIVLIRNMFHTHKSTYDTINKHLGTT